MRRLCVLGATGSIGASALDVVARHPDRYAVHALAGGHRVEALADLCARFQPARAAIADPDGLDALADALRARGLATEALAGPAALAGLAADPGCDTVIAAIVGAAGLASTLAAAGAGKRLLLANKEAVVMAGELLFGALARGGGELLPVDSEHNAIFQCLPAGFDRDLERAGVARLILTASGGPFRDWSAAELAAATPEQACAHPNWAMGRKISVDSATLMNKGLEVIEAHWLFGAGSDRIEVLVHPQSLVHSLVEYRDGSVLAQLGSPDMRTVLAHALAWPERIAAGVAPLDLVRAGRLDFHAPDRGRFPCLDLAYQALRTGGSAPCALNAANEVAVAAFLEGRLSFPGIAAVVESALAAERPARIQDLDSILAYDAAVRRDAWTAVARLGAVA
ncbi:MAG: 1-deoxy-D-xylulose-5-phosphate reductoisomerase [Xanthomonadales bacterium]|nr:1-deoxy-D-xylulose-5-phosphate reductoisomerase [Xanthomonadales bacterium]